MKIDIFSGFLGAGKTTLIKKLIKEAYVGEKVVLIENEFGEIGVDGGFMQDAGINVTEMNSGCICCSLVGDFSKALKQTAETYSPDRILIEPSGVGKLSDVIKAVKNAELENATLNVFCVVVDAAKCKMYMKNFGEFFFDQVENASCIILSHTDKLSDEKIQTAVALLKERNANATYITASWDMLDGAAILSAMEQKNSLQADLDKLSAEVKHHHEHHHHGEECDDPDCCCHHEHHHHHHEECDDPDCCCHHEHHHHDGECDDPDCCCHHEHDSHEHHHEHDHEHHHEHGHGCGCGHDHEHEHVHGTHEHHHRHHGHHADEVFVSWGKETVKTYTQEQLAAILKELEKEEKYGIVLRAKGIVAGVDGWLHFDYVPGEGDVRTGNAGVTGRLCVIGCNLQEDALAALFNV